MKFLVDVNLPPRLCVWLRSHRHEADHLFDRNLLTAPDTEIWERGRVENLVIFSKDVDFYDRALLFGAPPQVVHVAVGNFAQTHTNNYCQTCPIMDSNLLPSGVS